MTEENTNAEGLTEEDLAAIQASLSEGVLPTLQHTILEIWLEVTQHAEGEIGVRLGPADAGRLMHAWPRLELSDMRTYWDLYHRHITEMRDLLVDLVAQDKAALEHVEDDAEYNHDTYIEVMFAWQDRIQQWDDSWEIDGPRAYAELAAMSDAAQFFIGQEGLLNYLREPQVGFEYSEEERASVNERIREAQKERKQSE